MAAPGETVGTRDHRRSPGYRAFLVTAPRTERAAVYVLGAVVILSLIVFLGVVSETQFLYGFLFVFLIPAYAAAFLSGPFAQLLGGQLTLKRSFFIVFTTLGLIGPIALLWRVVELADPGIAGTLPALLLLLQGPILWFRQISLFGVSRPSHARSLPPALLQPVLAVAGVLVLFHPGWTYYLAAAAILAVGFLASALLLWAADRPLRRSFGESGVALLRPMMDHVDARDPTATKTIEEFFARFSLPVDLRITVVGFRGTNGPVATIVLPTVHPGPFASLGASDLPRKLGDRFGSAAGVVLVPHTPCNHDQDLPTGGDVDLVADAARKCFEALGPAAPSRASPLVSPHPGSLARAQVLGDAALVFVSQAPAPTDDIDLAIGEQVYAHYRAAGGPRVALVDAHNSFREGEGDLSFGMPRAAQLVADAKAAVDAAVRAARDGPLRVGVAVRDGYDTASHGIGPHGIRCLVVEAAGTHTAYVVIDGNNLLTGIRATILDALANVVEAAEIATTDNHVVHEVDGGVNPVGERYPIDSLVRDVRSTVEHALAHLTPVEVRSGERPIPGVRVLQPAWTVRLMTALSDTFVVFTSALLSTFLLVLTTSLVIFLLVV